MSIPKQKCKHDNMWAVPGTDTCHKHGGKIPQTIAEANQRVAEARKRLLSEAHDSRRADEQLFRTVEAQTIESLKTSAEVQPMWLHVPDELLASAMMPITVNNDSVSKSLLIERIETKIAEYEESFQSSGDQGEQGVVLGLELALEIIEDSYKN